MSLKHCVLKISSLELKMLNKRINGLIGLNSHVNYGNQKTMTSSSIPVFAVLAISVLTGGLLPRAVAAPSISAAVNSVSNSPVLAPGAFVSIYGSDLAGATQQAPTLPLPTTLGGTAVTINGIPAPLIFASATMVNALVPFELTFSREEAEANRKAVSIVVTCDGVASAPHTVYLSSTAPAIYTLNMTGSGPPLAFNAAFQPVTGIAPKDMLVLYASGLGSTDPPGTTGSGGASFEPLNRVPSGRMPEVYIGDQRAAVSYAGLAPGFPGVYQVNVLAPEALFSDRVYLRSGNMQSNVATLAVAPGQNAMNVTGTIEGLYPADGSNPLYAASTAPFRYSLMTQAVAFRVSLDIAPNARAFGIVAVGQTGSSQIWIDPEKSTWTATATVPSPRVRSGDFSDAHPALMDYARCATDSTGLRCPVLPGSVIPPGAMDARQAEAIQLLPMPNADSQGGVGTLTNSGTLPRDRHLVIESGSALGSYGFFGGIAQIPLGYSETLVAPLRLYVDGKLIASRDVTYAVVKRP